jgi:hypothetical protein
MRLGADNPVVILRDINIVIVKLEGIMTVEKWNSRSKRSRYLGNVVY